MSYSYYQLRDFSGGENSASSSVDLKDNQCLVCENVELLADGGFKKRRGITLHSHISSTATTINRIIRFTVKENGTGGLKTYIAALVGGTLKLISLPETVLVAYNIGNTEISYQSFNDKLYFLMNNKFYVYDGAGAATEVTSSESDSNLNAIKKCKYLEQRGQRLFAAGNPDEPNTLYFSEVGKPTYWKTTNIIKAITEDDDVITGIREYHGSLIVFKANSIFAWNGYDPYSEVTFKQLSSHTGTRAYRTVCNVGNYLVFLGEDGVYALVGTYENVIVTIKLSDNIQKRIDTITHKTPHYKNTAVAVYYDGKYMLSVDTNGDGANDKVFVLYADTIENKQSWVVFTHFYAMDFFYVLELNSLWIIGKENDRRIYRWSDEEENIYYDQKPDTNDVLRNEGISDTVITRPLYMDVLAHDKKFRRGYIVAKQYKTDRSALVKWYTDSNTGSLTSQAFVSIPKNTQAKEWDIASFSFNIKEKTKQLILEIKGSGVHEPFEVQGITLEYKIKKPDKS